MCLRFFLVTLLCVPWTAGLINREEVAKLAKLARGTELVYIQDDYHSKKAYPRLEDFFWTGSGDGPQPEDVDHHWPSSQHPDTEGPSTTVFTTKTVLSTIFVTRTSIDNQTTGIEFSTPGSCIHGCEGVSTPGGEIKPTPTLFPGENSSPFPRPVQNATTDRHFWLVTVLKDGRKEPIPDELENSLAKLYRKAFQRQQERHLGIAQRTKRSTENIVDEKTAVHAYIHNIEKSRIDDDEKIEVVYHVSVAGQPVAAVTAAQDMQLVSDEEVIQELGYPVLTKAEPYLKESEPQSLSKSNTTWIFIGTALALIFILLVIVLILTLSINKRKRSGLNNRQQIFGREMSAEGQVNKGYADEETRKKYQSGRRKTSPTYINYKGNDTLRSGTSVRPSSSRSTSTTSGSSIDISPLMSLNNKQRSPLRKHMRSKGSTNRTAPLPPKLSSSDSGSDRVDMVIRNAQEVISPKSYLSMPSIKSFPRGNIPEPLNRVLEPVSVLHLDMIDDNEDETERNVLYTRQQFTRHGSMGAEDPGVIGPLVWDLHCHRMQKGLHADDDSDDQKVTSNVARMRKRFHELLDDTFSLFGSRRDSVEDIAIRQPKPQPRAVMFENRGHSAIEKNESELTIAEHLQRQRPRTSDPRRINPNPSNDPPRGAWGSGVPSPLVRPLSAPFRKPTPHVDVQHVLAEGNFQPNDPAVPLIEAIKTELGKTSLPGSTANLAE